MGVELKVVHGAEQVAARIDMLAGEIAARHRAGRPPVLVVIAEGARRFALALERGLRERGLAPEALAIRVRRSAGGTALGALQAEALDCGRVAGREVLIVDDIADEGLTMREVERQVLACGAAAIERAVLVSKPARRQVQLRLDYVGFEIADGWVVGYGMDLDGAYRELDFLAIAEVSEHG